MKAHFFVHCSQCNRMCAGKLRVRCAQCKGGAFTVYKDPECWDDVLMPQRIPGLCETTVIGCTRDGNELPFAEFYFKCAEHTSQGEKDFAVPLTLIKRNIKQIPCLSCTDVSDPILVFPCDAGHVTCIECFRQYCLSRLMDRQFVTHKEHGYTLPCPTGCENSFITEIHHFKVLTKDQYDRYQRFATEEFVLQAGGVLCPQPDCGMGLLVDVDCKKVTCEQGCGVSTFAHKFDFNWFLLFTFCLVRFLSRLFARLSYRRMHDGWRCQRKFNCLSLQYRPIGKSVSGRLYLR